MIEPPAPPVEVPLAVPRHHRRPGCRRSQWSWNSECQSFRRCRQRCRSRWRYRRLHPWRCRRSCHPGRWTRAHPTSPYPPWPPSPPVAVPVMVLPAPVAVATGGDGAGPTIKLPIRQTVAFLITLRAVKERDLVAVLLGLLRQQVDEGRCAGRSHGHRPATYTPVGVTATGRGCRERRSRRAAGRAAAAEPRRPASVRPGS